MYFLCNILSFFIEFCKQIYMSVEWPALQTVIETKLIWYLKMKWHLFYFINPPIYGTVWPVQWINMCWWDLFYLCFVYSDCSTDEQSKCRETCKVLYKHTLFMSSAFQSLDDFWTKYRRRLAGRLGLLMFLLPSDSSGGNAPWL